MRRSTPASLSVKGQVTKHITVKKIYIIEFSNGHKIFYYFTYFFCFCMPIARSPATQSGGSPRDSIWVSHFIHQYKLIILLNRVLGFSFVYNECINRLECKRGFRVQYGSCYGNKAME